MQDVIFSQRPVGLADWVCEQLKEQILDCSLPPGARIVERDLCAKMGISRTPLREALNRLSREGLVILIRHRGYQVTPITVQDLRNLFELRRILEPESAYLAAERATPEELAELRRLAELSYKPGDRRTYHTYVRSNTAFHLELARCSHNALLASQVLSLLEQLQRPLCLDLDIGLDAKAATAEHLVLVETVEAHNPSLARRVMIEQVTNAERRLLEVVEAASEPRARKRT